MTNYMLLYSGGGMPEGEAEAAAVMKEWMSWFEKLGSSVVDQGNPFTPAIRNIASNGKVSNGSGGLKASGYSIIKADSLDKAAEMARSCPVLKSGAQITVLEIMPAM